MNPELIDPCSLPSLPLAEKRQLPTVPGIYFLMDGNKPLYIGKAKNLKQRWVRHHRAEQASQVATEPRIAWLQCDLALLSELEPLLQEQFKPKLNNTKQSKENELRAYVSRNLKSMIKAITGLKNGGRDWTISDITTEALAEWLHKPENLEIIERHNLKDLLDEVDQVLKK